VRPLIDYMTPHAAVPTRRRGIFVASRKQRMRQRDTISVRNLLQNPYDITHLTLDMLLHYFDKLKIQIFLISIMHSVTYLLNTNEITMSNKQSLRIRTAWLTVWQILC